MFRPLTVIAITAFCVVGWNVYRAEDAARQLDRDLRDLTKRIEIARDRTQVLKAEWALLNEPERLRQVAQKHLTLETMVPAQFIRLPELERRLPVAIAFAGPVNLFAPAPGSALALANAARAAAPASAPAAQATAAVMASIAPSSAAPVGAALAGHAPVGAGSAVAAARPQAPRAEIARLEPARPEAARADTARPDTARAEPVRQPAIQTASRAEEPRRRPAPALAPVPRTEAVALREPVPEARQASATGSLLRQALHLPISSANAATLPQPGTGGSIGQPTGSALGFASRGTLAPPVPVR